MTAAILLTALAFVAGKPVDVTVWPGPGSWGGSASPGLGHINIGEDAYQSAMRGEAHGLLVLLHEAAHTTGIEDEATANCWALLHIPGFVQRYWLTTLKTGWSRRREAILFMHAQSARYQCPGV